MAEPIAAIIKLTCAIAGAIQQVQKIRRKPENLMSSISAGQGVSGAFELSQMLNSLISKLGRRFGEKLDERVEHEITCLGPQLRALFSDLETLEADATQAEANIKNEDEIEKRIQKFLDQANDLRNTVKKTLGELSNRISLRAESLETPLKLPLRFCYGAIRCQLGKADSKSLSSHACDSGSQRRWGFICRYCYMEVGDYHAVRFSHMGEAMIYSDMLAASHVVACESLNNRRAYYKCLACYENHMDKNFVSAVAFEKHMQEHPDYSIIKNEKEIVKTTREQIKNFVLEVSFEAPLVDKKDGDTIRNERKIDEARGVPFLQPSNGRRYLEAAGNDAKASPISSPALSFREPVEKPEDIVSLPDRSVPDNNSKGWSAFGHLVNLKRCRED